MEPEVLGLLVAAVASGLPAAAARFLRRRRLTVDEQSAAENPQVSADATLAEAADIARADGADEVVAVNHHQALGTLHVQQTTARTSPQPPRNKRIDISFADVMYGIAMVAGIAAKAVWDYENQHHKVGINLLQIDLALLAAPIVYIGVGSHLKLSLHTANTARESCGQVKVA
jgi:hypothetical protein